MLRCAEYVGDGMGYTYKHLCIHKHTHTHTYIYIYLKLIKVQLSVFYQYLSARCRGVDVLDLETVIYHIVGQPRVCVVK